MTFKKYYAAHQVTYLSSSLPPPPDKFFDTKYIQELRALEYETQRKQKLTQKPKLMADLAKEIVENSYYEMDGKKKMWLLYCGDHDIVMKAIMMKQTKFINNKLVNDILQSKYMGDEGWLYHYQHDIFCRARAYLTKHKIPFTIPPC